MNDFLANEPGADDEGGGTSVSDAEGEGPLPGRAAEDGSEGKDEGVSGKGEEGDTGGDNGEAVE